MRAIEVQIKRVLELVSPEEKKRNRALSKQTERLARAVLALRGPARSVGEEDKAAGKK